MSNETYPKIYLYRRLVQAKLFMDTHYADNIDLNNIADEAFFSKFHFIRLFKKIYGVPPHQYLIQVRLAKAKELLGTKTAVAETCYCVGFESISSFTGLFKRSFGITPSAYQLSETSRRTNITLTPLSFIPNCFAEKKGWTKNSNFKEVVA